MSGAKENLLVSACLLGEKCKYSGGSNENPGVIGLGERYRLIPVCPEAVSYTHLSRDSIS